MTLSDFELINANDEVFQDAVGVINNNNDLKKVENIHKADDTINKLAKKTLKNEESLLKDSSTNNLIKKNEINEEDKFLIKDANVDQNSNLLVDEKIKTKNDKAQAENAKTQTDNVKVETKNVESIKNKIEDIKNENKNKEKIEIKEKINENVKTDINDNLENIIKNNKINDEISSKKKGLYFKDIKFKIEKNVENLRIEDKDLSFEECLENGRQMMIKFVDNKFEEVLEILEHQSNISIIHKLGAAAVLFFDSILSMDKEKMSLALVSMKEAAEYADIHRKKTSYLNYLFSPDYNSFSDVECHAELCYATSQLVSGLLIALEDQSVYGFVNGGLKIRMAYSAFRECYNILKHKLNWESSVARMHFESGTRLGIGAFDLIISFFPSKLAKLLEYIGFNSDRDLAIEELTAAVNLVDGLYYDISSILLSSYYGFLEYFYGLGESDTNFFDKSAKIWQQRTPNSSVVKIGFGVREMLLGQPDKAIKYFEECVEGQTFWLQLHFACSWEICWSYVMKSDWDNAAKYAEILKDQCKWSPAMFTYLYAAFLFMEMEQKNKPELAEKISNELRKIPKLKRKIGGKRAFHEKIVVERSKKFHDNIQNWLLPPLELLYIWNIFHMMAKEPKLLTPILENIETKLKTHVKFSDLSKKLDQYCYLIFMKGVIKRHLNEKEEAIKLFQEVISCKKRIKDEIHLLPQSCFEIGMIHRENNKLSEAKKWLKKAKDDYHDYLTESMIQYRVVWALDLIRKKKIAE